jgi:hypothetical protein
MPNATVRITTNCAECGEPIALLAAVTGGLIPGDYTLVADWIFHPACWDKVAERGVITLERTKR